MSEELKTQLETGLAGLGEQLKTAMDASTAEIEKGEKVSTELTGQIDNLSGEFKSIKDELTALAQKMTPLGAEETLKSAGAEFVAGDAFKSLVDGQTQRARFELKNTVLATAGTTYPDQRPGVVPGDFAPVTIRDRLSSIPVSSNSVTSMRELAWTNSAAEVAEGAAKPESAITFEQYTVIVETIAHWLKVSNQLLADAPAVAAYIDTRLRDGLAQKVDAQLLLGNGTTPALSGLTDAGNFTAFTPTTGANLVESINKAKYALWALGRAPDTVVVNPAAWGAMELEREGSGSGMYLYGAPGTHGGMSPFGVQVVLSNNMPLANFLIGDLNGSCSLYNRQGATVEMGFVDDDFTKNLVTIRAEERMGLGTDRASGIMYGAITA